MQRYIPNSRDEARNENDHPSTGNKNGMENVFTNDKNLTRDVPNCTPFALYLDQLDIRP